MQNRMDLVPLCASVVNMPTASGYQNNLNINNEHRVWQSLLANINQPLLKKHQARKRFIYYVLEWQLNTSTQALM